MAKKKCENCIYRTRYSDKIGCAYILCENEPRPCSAVECTVYKRGSALYKSISNKAYDVKRKGIYAHNIAVSKGKKTGNYPFEKSLCDDYVNGKSISALAQTYGIADVTVRKILDKNDVQVRAKGWAGQKGNKMKNFSEETISALVEDYSSGMSIDMLAITYGMSKSTVSKYLHKSGVEIRTRGGDNGNSKLSDEEAKALCADYTDGMMTTKELAIKYDIADATVILYLHKAGVEMRPRGFKRKKQPEQVATAQTEEVVSVEDDTPNNIVAQEEEYVKAVEELSELLVNSSEPEVNSSEPEVNVPTIPNVLMKAIVSTRYDLIVEQKYCYEQYWKWKAAIEEADRKIVEVNEFLDKSGIDVNSLSDFPEYEPGEECYND